MKVSLAREFNGYYIKSAIKSGGKAGKGLNRTSTIQVVDKQNGGSVIRKMFSFITENSDSYLSAVNKAKQWILDNPKIL